MFGLLSSKPHYSHIIDDFIALAPVVFASNTYGIPLRPLSPLHPIFRLAMNQSFIHLINNRNSFKQMQK